MSLDKYKSLAFHSKLYPAAIINNKAASQINWNVKSNREKELLLLKITCNVLLCNLELLEEQKRKHENENQDQEQKKQKAKIEDTTSNIESTTASCVASTEMKSSSSSNTTATNDSNEEFYSAPEKFK